MLGLVGAEDAALRRLRTRRSTSPSARWSWCSATAVLASLWATRNDPTAEEAAAPGETGGRARGTRDERIGARAPEPVRRSPPCAALSTLATVASYGLVGRRAAALGAGWAKLSPRRRLEHRPGGRRDARAARGGGLAVGIRERPRHVGRVPRLRPDARPRRSPARAPLATAARRVRQHLRARRAWWWLPSRPARVVTGAPSAGQDRTYLSAAAHRGRRAGAPTTEIAAQLTGALDAVARRRRRPHRRQHGERRRPHLPRHRAGRRLRPAGAARRRLLLVPPGRSAATPPASVWLAWYSNATGQVGIFMVPLDPATGAPVGSGRRRCRRASRRPTTAFHLALACAGAPAESSTRPRPRRSRR